VTRYAIVGAIVSLVAFTVVLELIRTRRLQERYAMLWLLTIFAVFVLSVWQTGLRSLSQALGVVSPANALFAVAIAFIALVLLQYSTVISRLTDQNQRLAQRLAQLEERQLRASDDDQA
jgi:hypothetical protein